MEPIYLILRRIERKIDRSYRSTNNGRGSAVGHAIHRPRSGQHKSRHLASEFKRAEADIRGMAGKFWQSMFAIPVSENPMVGAPWTNWFVQRIGNVGWVSFSLH